jgi:hypothetical protein
MHGTVTVANGEKLSYGSITFMPPDGKPGPSATAPVTEGNYKFDRENGPTSGPQVVIVKWVDPGRARVAIKVARKSAVSGKTEWRGTANISDDGKFLCDFAFKN